MGVPSNYFCVFVRARRRQKRTASTVEDARTYVSTLVCARVCCGCPCTCMQEREKARKNGEVTIERTAFPFPGLLMLDDSANTDN